MQIGCHLSLNKYIKMVKEAELLGANTFQCFLRSPMGGKLPSIDYEDIKLFNEHIIENNFGPILFHGPFVANAASNKEEIRELSRNLVHEDLKRLNNIENALYVLHPGCHMKQGIPYGIEQIANMINFAMFKGQKTTFLLETMSGKGTEIGRNFEELSKIIELVENKDKIGICLDTCHIWDGGYDIQDNLDKVINDLDLIIGLDKLKAIHMNNSLNNLNSHKDKHAGLLNGKIKSETFLNIINHPKLQNIPIYLETPEIGYKQEIDFLKKGKK